MDITTTQAGGRRLVGLRDFMQYCGLGKTNAAKLGHDSGCRVQIGGRVLYDLRRADAYIDRLATSEPTES